MNTNPPKKITLIIISIMMTSLVVSTSSAWDARFDTWKTPEWHATYGHNWIVYQAIEALAENGLVEGMYDPLDPIGSPGDHLTPFEYISYGLWYADNVWAGPPVLGDLIQIIGESYDHNGTTFFKDVNFDKGEHYAGPIDEYMVETTYRTNHSDKPTNIHLEARWFAKQTNNPATEVASWFNDEFDISFEEEERWAADNIFHYANANKIDLRDTPHHDADENIFGDSQFGAREYGTELYLLAKKFWPANIMSTPSLSDLNYYSENETGKLYMDEFFDRNSGIKYAQLPSFFAGANPFICSASTVSQVKDDACVHGDPTWPLWVPHMEDIARVNDPLTKQQDYQEMLRQDEASKNRRAALIYLGWALHLLGDLSMPQHAADYVTPYHGSIEDQANELCSISPYFRHAAAQLAKESMFTQMKNNISGYCENIGAGINKQGQYGKLWSVFENLRKFSLNYEQEYRDYWKDQHRIHPAHTLTLLTEAARSSAQLIACMYNTSESALFPAIAAPLM